jgi:hypothetical protein
MICHFPVRFHRAVRLILAVLSLGGTAVPAWAQFETRATQTVPGDSFGIAVGDFNHDGKLDVAIAGDGLSILLGNGDGTFQPPITYPGLYYSIAAADFNNDGNLDLVVAPDSNSLSIYLGNGDGTFQSPISAPTTYACGFITVGDFNHDHKVDIVVTDYKYISVLLGNGDGTFKAPIDNNSFVGPGQLAVGDFNNDHMLDVAVVGSFGSSASVGVLLGNGDGTLQNSLTYPLANTPGSVAAADFRGNGKLDLAISPYLFNDVIVLLGNGDGSFQPAVEYPGGGDVLVQDFNRDGYLDIVSGFTLLLGNGDGTFRLAPTGYTPNGGGVSDGLEAAGDFNGDALPDLAYLVNNPIGGVTTMLNTGAVAFSTTTPITFPTQLIGTTSAPLSATLTNNGASPLTISSVTSSGEPFHMRTTCKGSVAPGGNCSITATFSPRVENAVSGAVTIHDSASSKPQVVELVGTGTVVQLSPGQLTFPPQKTGTISPSQRVRLTNTGSTGLSFTSIYINGLDYKDFSESNNCPASLNTGASCTISVVFAPRQTGSLSDYIQITDTGGGSPQTVPLSGTGD